MTADICRADSGYNGSESVYYDACCKLVDVTCNSAECQCRALPLIAELGDTDTYKLPGMYLYHWCNHWQAAQTTCFFLVSSEKRQTLSINWITLKQLSEHRDSRSTLFSSNEKGIWKTTLPYIINMLLFDINCNRHKILKLHILCFAISLKQMTKQGTIVISSAS